MLSTLLKVFACLFLLPAAVVCAADKRQLEKESAYSYINRLRSQTGMITFQKNSQLEASATNHVRYLSVNSLVGHLQTSKRKHYTGKKPDDRALFAGYSARDVTENFSAGQKNARDSIDGLMGAIYHRFAFLDFSKNELGIGIEENHKGLNFVYNMGNSQLDSFCRFAIFLNDGPFYTNVCRHGGKVSSREFNLRKKNIGRQNPELIVWPFDSATQIPTAFFEEIPDPLPDYRVSGYPVSAQINPFLFKKVELIRFKLFDQTSGRMVKPVRVITKQLDPNQRFSAFDFALFPLNRLEWDREYRAEIALEADDRLINKTWQFRTVRPEHPMFVIFGRNEILKLESGREYLVHIPPERKLPIIEQLRWESMSGMKTEVSWQDRNTISVKLTGDTCESTHFFLNGERSFILQVAEMHNLNTKQRYASGTLSGCLINTIKDLPGFRIAGRGEVIPMKADRDYWVEITTEDQPVTEVSWQLLNNMTVQVNHLERNLLRIRLSGLPGQIATFYLSNSGLFKVVLTE